MGANGSWSLCFKTLISTIHHRCDGCFRMYGPDLQQPIVIMLWKDLQTPHSNQFKGMVPNANQRGEELNSEELNSLKQYVFTGCKSEQVCCTCVDPVCDQTVELPLIICSTCRDDSLQLSLWHSQNPERLTNFVLFYCLIHSCYSQTHCKQTNKQTQFALICCPK